ncbi:MAG TPA: T9SS type A sorting domain-containing protein, partial [Chitinophagales bacterium]|nr:T9SS type A sorting domain-containing protein [Chitinophagales bacterium]
GSAATYAWSPSTGLNNANINAPVATPTNSTTYTVVATASNGCTASTQVTVEVIACAVGMDDIVATDFVSLYPNPATDGVTIWVEAPTSTTATLQLFDVTGKLVFQNKINTNTTQYIAVDQLPKGVYYAQILTTDKQYRQELVVW